MFNVSESFYQHGKFIPIYGNGQGSINSPSAWLFISNNIFKCHCKNAYGAQYQDPEGTITVRLYLAGFVDDTNLYANIFHSHTYEIDELIRRLHQDIHWFSSLLWTTGGKLEPRKCNYTVMHWLFDEAGNPYLDHTNYNTMDIRDSNGKVCSRIKYMNPTQASKYLGHTKETAGTQSHQEQNSSTSSNRRWHL